MLFGIDLSTVSFAEPLYLWLLVLPGTLLVASDLAGLRRRADAGGCAGRACAGRRTSSAARRYRLLAGRRPRGLGLHCRARQARGARCPRCGRASADIVILQDGSASMHVTDVAPNRWRRSVQFLRAFGETLSWRGDRVALAIFAYHAAPQVRLTKDPNALFFFIDHLGEQPAISDRRRADLGHQHRDRRVVGAPAGRHRREAVRKDEQPKAFVVISDGQAWSGTVGTSAGHARARGVLVYAVGVGTTTGGVIPDPLGRPPSTRASIVRRLPRLPGLVAASISKSGASRTPSSPPRSSAASGAASPPHR